MAERTDEQREADRLRKERQRAKDRESGFTEILVKVRTDRVEEMREHEIRLQKKKRSTK